jgi:hypothetical protein
MSPGFKNLFDNNFILKILFYIIFILSISGCSVYSPHLVDIPLISEKSELRFDGGYTWQNMFYGSLSYGLTKSISLQTFYNKDAGETFYFQNAAGYYRKIGKDAVMEIWGGYGFGHTDIGNHDVPTNLRGSQSLTFAQFNLGRKDVGKAHADFGFGLKGGWFKADLTDINYFANIPQYTGAAESLMIKSFILEPGIFFRLGGEHLKFSLKLAVCKSFQQNNIEKPLPVEEYNYGIGINYRF